MIISVDTLKDDGRYRHYLEQCHWDVVVIDECHNVANETNLRHRLARLLAQHCDALIFTSATPHNGTPESFANLMNMLDPTAIANPDHYTADDIRGLYVRRFKKDVAAEVQDDFCERDVDLIRLPATAAEEAFLARLNDLKFHTLDKGTAKDALYRTTVFKAFLSSPAGAEALCAPATLRSLSTRLRNASQSSPAASKRC